MNDHKKPIPLEAALKGVVCPVCGKRAYSAGGIHPQCAVQQADAPRQKLLAQQKKASLLAAKSAPPRAAFGVKPGMPGQRPVAPR